MTPLTFDDSPDLAPLYTCEDCDFTTNEGTHAEDHELETGHTVVEAE